jgi:hypothetical protein
MAPAICLLVLLLVSFSASFSQVSGTAQIPNVLELTPPEVDFGAQTVGAPGSQRKVALHNIGNATLELRDITPSGIDFSQSNDCPTVLLANASCTIQVTFKPAITGPRIGTIIITASDPHSPHMLVLNGTGQ